MSHRSSSSQNTYFFIAIRLESGDCLKFVKLSFEFSSFCQIFTCRVLNRGNSFDPCHCGKEFRFLFSSFYTPLRSEHMCKCHAKKNPLVKGLPIIRSNGEYESRVYHSENPSENDISPVNAQQSKSPIRNSGLHMLSSIEAVSIGRMIGGQKYRSAGPRYPSISGREYSTPSKLSEMRRPAPSALGDHI